LTRIRKSFFPYLDQQLVKLPGMTGLNGLTVEHVTPRLLVKSNQVEACERKHRNLNMKMSMTTSQSRGCRLRLSQKKSQSQQQYQHSIHSFKKHYIKAITKLLKHIDGLDK